MKSILIRTASSPINAFLALGSLKFSFSDEDTAAGVSSGRRRAISPKPALHFELKPVAPRVRRSVSEASLTRSESVNSDGPRGLSRRFSRSIPARIEEEKDFAGKKLDSSGELEEDGGSLMLKWKAFELEISDRVSGIWPGNEVAPEELEFSGGGTGEGRKFGGDKGGGGGGGDEIRNFSGGSADQNKIGAYYKEMLKSNPGNPLLLRNYGNYLHEVERDMVKAEEYYGRAILANPGDGEVLSLYGRLLWEAEGDGERAQVYFDQAIEASPDDCYVLGSYAKFLWDAEDDEEENGAQLAKSSTLVAAY